MESATLDIDYLDKLKRLEDIEESMLVEKTQESVEGLSREVFGQTEGSYAHLNQTRRKDIEEDLLVAVGSEEHKHNELVSSLMQDLHTVKSDLRASEMQLSHAHLQVDALSISELNLRNERDTLQFNLAELEQDKLLLETKLKSIAGFEGGRGGSELGMESVRGKLLDMANHNIKELSAALREEKSSNEAAKKDGYIAKLATQIKSLRAELKGMGEQLARRTVLYSAQERRFRDSSRASDTLHSEKNQENAELRARLQQMEKQFEHVDRGRLETQLRNKELEQSQQLLQEQLSDAMERNQQLDVELTGLTSQNASLQTTIQHLRGANFEELERGMVAEVEEIRAESQARETELRQQLEAARELLSQDAEKRDTLVDEVVHLRSELADKVDLLHRVHSAQKKGLLVEKTQDLAPISHENPEDDEGALLSPGRDVEQADFTALFEDMESPATQPAASPRAFSDLDLFYDNSNGPNVLYGSNLAHSALHVLQVLVAELFSENAGTESVNETVLLEVIREGSEWHHACDKDSETFQALQGRVKGMVEDAYEHAPEGLEGSDSWGALARAMTRILGGIASRIEAVKKRERGDRAKDESSLSASTASHVLSKNFLVAEPEPEHADTETVATSVVDSLQEELSALKEELKTRRRREHCLHESLKEQGSKLAVVLERAATLPGFSTAPSAPPAPTAIGADEEKVKRLRGELEEVKSALSAAQSDKERSEERARGYREEIAALQEEAERFREMINLLEADNVSHEAAEQEKESKNKEDDETVTIVEVLGDQFREVNRRQFAEAEVVALKDKMEDLGQEITRLSDQLQEAENKLTIAADQEAEVKARFIVELEMAHEEAQQRLGAAVGSERESMQREMASLVDSLKQDYEAKLVTASASASKALSTPPTTATVSTTTGYGEEAVEEGSQTDPRSGDSAVDQRVTFAVAQQQVDDNKKYAQALEVQRFALERAHQLDLADKVATVQKEFEAEIASSRQAQRNKYHARMRAQHEEARKEKLQLIHLIKGLSEAKDAIDNKRGAGEGVRSFPEVLSSEATAAMVKGISNTLLQSSLDSSRSSTGSFLTNSTGTSSMHEFHSARNSMEKMERVLAHDSSSSVTTPDDDSRKQSRDSSLTATPPSWTRRDLDASELAKIYEVEMRGGAIETPHMHAIKEAKAPAPAPPAEVGVVHKSPRSGVSRSRAGKQVNTGNVNVAKRLFVSKGSPEKVLKPATASRTPELGRGSAGKRRK